MRTNLLAALLTVSTVAVGLSVWCGLAYAGCRPWLAMAAGVSLALAFVLVPAMVRVEIENE